MWNKEHELVYPSGCITVPLGWMNVYSQIQFPCLLHEGFHFARRRLGCSNQATVD